MGVVVWWLCRVWAPASNGVRILKKLACILLFEGVWVLLVLADAISHLVTSSLCPVTAWGRWREFVLTMRQ